MIRLDFCIVGPQRTSTTWIYETLLRSGQVNLPIKVKETFFFDQKYSKGFDYYFSLFANQVSSCNGEIAPTYFHRQEVATRIYKHNPDCKIVIVYRNPVEKAISLYKHHYRKGRVGGDISKAVEKFPEIIESGFYRRYVSHWEELFGHNNVKVINYSLLRHNPQAYINEITSFLGLFNVFLTEEDTGLINEASVPKFPLLARIFSFGATLLRKYDLHYISSLGKALGLTKVYSGGSSSRDYHQEKDWLNTFFEEDDYLFKN